MQDQPQRARVAPPRLPASVARPVRESLRGVRQFLHAGRDVAHDVVEHAPLPPPINSLARSILSEVDVVARRMEGFATEVVRGVLGDDPSPPASCSAGDEVDRRFAESAGAALNVALKRLDAAGVTVDLAAIAGLHAELRGADAPERDTARAAALIQGLLRAAFVGDGATRDVLPVAAFATMLWFLSDRSRDAAALIASIDLSAALASEIGQAANDRARLAGLLAEFRDHV